MRIGFVIAIVWIVGLFLGLVLPFILVSAKGFDEHTWKKETKTKITVKTIIRGIIMALLLMFVVPSVLYFVHNYINLVIISKYPVRILFDDFAGYSYQPVMNFYSDFMYYVETWFLALIS